METETKKIKIYVLCGYKGSGKDTLVTLYRDYLKTNFKTNVTIEKYAFADPLKDICYNVFSKNCRQLQRNHFDKVEYKESPIQGLPNETTPRDLCLEVSKCIRGIYDNYFIDLIMKKINNSISYHKFHDHGNENANILFVTDCRFQEELYAVKNLQQEHTRVEVKTFWIKRFETPPNSHPSENSLNERDCDYIVENISKNTKTFLENFIGCL